MLRHTVNLQRVTPFLNDHVIIAGEGLLSYTLAKRSPELTIFLSVILWLVFTSGSPCVHKAIQEEDSDVCFVLPAVQAAGWLMWSWGPKRREVGDSLPPR